jgi:hypothetical protein
MGNRAHILWISHIGSIAVFEPSFAVRAVSMAISSAFT